MRASLVAVVAAGALAAGRSGGAGDSDDVPDALDGCPFAADPLQTNTLGMGPDDACLGQPGADFAVGGAVDMTAPPGDGPDLAAPPDLAPVASECPNGTQSGVG